MGEKRDRDPRAEMNQARLHRAFAHIGILCAAILASTAVAAEDAETWQSMSGSEQVAAATKMAGQVQKSADAVRSLKKKAGDDNDLIKLNCIHPKVPLMSGHVAAANSGVKKVKQAVNKGDSSGAARELGKLASVKKSAAKVEKEAKDECVGEELAFQGKTTVKTTLPPGLPNDPTNATPPPDRGGGVLNRTPVASPYE